MTANMVIRFCVLIMAASAMFAPLAAQTIPLKPSDTVQVWFPSSPIARRGIVDWVAPDTIVVNDSALLVSSLQRIEVARGTSVSRKATAAWVGAGLVAGIVAGVLIKDRACVGCNAYHDSLSLGPTIVRLGAAAGAGLGYLVARTQKRPRWYTVWPLPADVQPPEIREP